MYTDLYELRMAASCLRRGMDQPATFSLFVRALPPDRGFLVAAGLADALTFLEGFHLNNLIGPVCSSVVPEPTATGAAMLSAFAAISETSAGPTATPALPPTPERPPYDGPPP